MKLTNLIITYNEYRNLAFIGDPPNKFTLGNIDKIEGKELPAVFQAIFRIHHARHINNGAFLIKLGLRS